VHRHAGGKLEAAMFEEAQDPVGETLFPHIPAVGIDLEIRVRI
jgi:hypothetical protein